MNNEADRFERELRQNPAGPIGEDIDRRLDDALNVYAKAEPRPGLEGRILARLAEARRESPQSVQWWGRLAIGLAAAVLVVAGWLGLSNRNTSSPRVKLETQQQNAGSPGTTSSGDSREAREEHATVSIPSRQARDRSGTRSASRSAEAMRRKDLDARVGPKLEQFPAASPLTEQEEMLVRYVREFPERATLVAQAQTELRKQVELEMAAPWPSKTNGRADQRE